MAWRRLNEDTSWIDGRDIVLAAHGMEVSARYCSGEWHHTLEFSEYYGPVWSCFDDKFQIEIEELSEDPTDWCFGAATHWRDATEVPT